LKGILMKKKLLVLLFSLAFLTLVACGGGNDVASSGATAVSAASPVTTPATPTTEPKLNGEINERTGVTPMVADSCPTPLVPEAPKEIGDYCGHDCQCKTNVCYGQQNINAPSGRCMPEKSPDGSPCMFSKNCESGYCGQNGAFGGEYGGTCGKIPNGKSCRVNANCQSDYCLANANGFRLGQCGDRYNNPKGYQCTLGSQCASGTCKGNGFFGGLPGICG